MSRQKFFRIPQHILSSDVVCWGDSMTAQGYPDIMAGTIPNTVRNAGVGGESSTAILARQGGAPFYFQPVGGAIPASGSVQVTITSPVGQWPLLQGSGTPGGSFSGLLAGVMGTITLTKSGAQYTHDAGDIYTFTRQTPGSSVVVSTAQPFITTFSEARRGDIAIIWAGQNNFSTPDQVVADIGKMIEHMTGAQKRYLVLAIVPSSERTQDELATIASLNQRLYDIYGDRFVDTLAYLQHSALADAGISPTAQDVQDIANGYTPTSLRQDVIHLNATGRTLIANLVGQALYDHAWVPSFTPVPFTTPSTTIWVATTGSDANAGTKSSPLKTFVAARDKVRSLTANGSAIPSGGVQVNVMAGVYPQTSTFVLSAADTGRAGAPIVWRSYGGDVTVTGSKTIPQSAYQTPDVATQALFPASIRNQIKMVDLLSLGIGYSPETSDRSNGSTMPTVVSVDGKLLTCARYPNSGWLSMEVGSDPGTTSGSADDGSVKTVTPAAFKETDATVLSWAGATGRAMVVAQPQFQWSTQYASITAIDAANQKVVIDQASWFGGIDTTLGRYYIYNLPQALDTPNEYYLNSDTGKLYFVPGVSASVALLPGPIVQLANLSYVRFDGINVAEGRQYGIYAMNCSNIAVTNSEVRSVNTGIMYETVTDSTIDTVHVHHVASLGIGVAGGDKPSLTRGNDVITNCEVDHFALRQLTYAPGVSLYGVGHTLLHNNIHDTPHEAVITWGCDHLIQDNWIHHAVNDNADAGAFYTGRDWTDRGNVLNRNLFSDIGTSDFRASSQVSIYFDDCSSGFTATNNIIVRGSRGFHHCGRDNYIANNVIIDSQDLAYYVGNWGANHTGNQQTLTDRYNALINSPNYNPTAWAKYPHFIGLLDDEPAVPKYNTIKDYIIANTTSGVVESSPIVPQVTISGIRQYETSQLNFDTSTFVATKNSLIVTGVGSFAGIDISKIYGCSVVGMGPTVNDGNGATIVNLSPAPDPTLNSGGWSGYGGQMVPFTSGGLSYTAVSVSGMLTAKAIRGTVSTTTANPIEVSCGRWTDSMSQVTAGKLYTVSLQVRSSVETMMRLRLRFYDEGLTTAYDIYSDYVTVSANTPVVLSKILTAPPTAYYMTVTAFTQNPLSIGSYIDATACMVVAGGTLYQFADGDSAGWAWNGVRGASTSIGAGITTP